VSKELVILQNKHFTTSVTSKVKVKLKVMSICTAPSRETSKVLRHG